MTWSRRECLVWAATAAATEMARPAMAAGPPPSPAAAPSAPPADARAVRLAAAPLPSAPSRLSYNGTPAGPVVRVKAGTRLDVSLTSALDHPTTLQWHGVRGPQAIDDAASGGGLPVAAGGTATQSFTPPDPGLFWFHPVAAPSTPDDTAAGLFGVLIVEEAAPPFADRDILVVASGNPGTAGVNGTDAPLREQAPPGARIRLRILNASTQAIALLSLDGARPRVVAIDGQPSDPFEPVRDSVPVGPGARFEMMLDMPSVVGNTVRLLSRAIPAGEGPRPPGSLLLELTAAGEARAPLPPIGGLPPNPALAPAIALERAVRTDLLIEAVEAAPGAARWRLNGRASLALQPTPLFKVPRGGSVTLGFANRSAVPVPLRLHGHVMRLLHAKDDGWEPYWRDSVILPPNAASHVAFVADNPGRWLIDSAVFDQAAGGLRCWFLVT